MLFPFPWPLATIATGMEGKHAAKGLIREKEGMQPQAIPAHSTVLICRLSHIGDCILTLPLANAIRAERPDVRIAWVVESPSDQLLRDHPAVDSVVRLPKNWRKSPSTWWAIRKELRDLRAAVCLDPQSLNKSAILSWLSGAPRRIGLSPPHGRELAPLFHNEWLPATHTHLQDRTMQFLRAIRLLESRRKYMLPRYPESFLLWDDFWERESLDGKIVAINPGGSWASKRWFPESYAAVARGLGYCAGFKSVVTWCGDEERTWSQQIVDESEGHAILAPATNLRQAAELYRRSALFLGSDTGPMHLAAAVETPCVVLYGPTTAAASGPVGTQHRAIQSPLPTLGNRKRATNAAMRGITPDDVLSQCLSVLGKQLVRAA